LYDYWYAGLDDKSELGESRKKKTLEVLSKTNIALVVIDGTIGVIHCGGCILNRVAMLSRIDNAVKHDIPIVNYGVLIGYVQGILERALESFPLAKAIYDGDYI